VDNDELLSFEALLINFKRVNLPEGWTTYSNNREIVFYKSNFIDGQLKIEKQFIFKNTLEICFYVYQLSVDIDKQSTKLVFPVNLRDISTFINIIDYKQICRGGPNLMNFPGRYPTDFIYHTIKIIKYISFCLIIYH